VRFAISPNQYGDSSSQSQLPVIAVVIPAYRAAEHIEQVLLGIPAFVRHIIVVEDCGPDNTAEIVAGWPDPRVQLVRHSTNQGVGGAMFTGYDRAIEIGAEIIVKMDSDDQMDPRYLLPLIEPIIAGEADYTKGNRFLRARELHAMPVQRRIGNVGLSFLTKLASGHWGVFDPANGYTAIHASALPLLDRNNIDRRYFYESSMLIELGIARACVVDVDMPAIYGDEVSSLNEWRTLRDFPVRLIRGFTRRLWVRYFVQDFSAFSAYLVFGLLLSVFGAIWGLAHWIRSSQLDVVTPTGTVMIAVLPIMLGIQLLLQATTLDIQNSPRVAIHRSRAYRLEDRERRATSVGT
jgi:dolichol-phosphate mannosyltransferase